VLKVVIYADDILLFTPSVTDLEYLLRVCEIEVNFLDMAINSSKSCCMGISSRCAISWSDVILGSELSYLGIFIAKLRNFKFPHSEAKLNFYSAVSGIFGEVLNLA